MESSLWHKSLWVLSGLQCHLSNIWPNSDNTNLVAAFLLWDSISCFRHSIPSMVSGPDSAPPRFGNVAEGSRREDASPLSLPGPFTDSDSEPCGSRRKMTFGELVKTDGWMDASERRSSRSQPNIKSRYDACFDLIAEPVLSHREITVTGMYLQKLHTGKVQSTTAQGSLFRYIYRQVLTYLS